MTLAPLKDIATVVMGLSPKGEFVTTEDGKGVPLLNGPTEFGSVSPSARQWTSHSPRMAEPGDILFCVRGSTTGKMNRAQMPYAIGRGIAAIRGADDVDTRVIYYSLVERLHVLLSLTSGSVFPNLSSDDIRNFEIEWPEKGERAAIAATLGALDDKIESNRRAVEKGEALIRTLVGRTLNASNAAEGTLGDYCALVKSTAKPKFISADENYIGFEHMPRGSVFLDDWAPAGELGSNKSRFERGDILFGKLRPYFKKVGIAPIDGVCSTDILVVRPVVSRDRALVACVAASDALIDSLSAASTGTRMPRASWKDLAAWPVPLLSITEREQLAASVDPMISRLENLIAESHRLASLRDALLPELLSGRIRATAEELVSA